MGCITSGKPVCRFFILNDRHKLPKLIAMVVPFSDTFQKQSFCMNSCLKTIIESNDHKKNEKVRY